MSPKCHRTSSDVDQKLAQLEKFEHFFVFNCVDRAAGRMLPSKKTRVTEIPLDGRIAVVTWMKCGEIENSSGRAIVQWESLYFKKNPNQDKLFGRDLKVNIAAGFVASGITGILGGIYQNYDAITHFIKQFFR